MPTAADLLRAARDPSSRSRERIATAELRAAWAAAKTPQAGEQAGKPITADEALLFQSINPSELTAYARDMVLPSILAEIPGLLQSGGGGSTGSVHPLPAKRGREVFLTTNAGFAADAVGAAPGSLSALTSTLHNAGKYLQACFGSGENMFRTAGLDNAGKRAVLAQLSAALSDPMTSLTAPQKEQLFGSSVALITELLKSIEFVPMAPAQNADLLALRDETYALLTKSLDDERMSVLVERAMVGYLAQSDSFQERLTSAQRADLQVRHSALFPEAPAKYAKWEAEGKSRIVIDHVSGQGENFVFGFVKQLQETGVDGRRYNSPKFTVLSGDTRNGPCRLEAKIPANHPINTWGREMTIEIRVREMRGDMYAGMGDAGVDIVHYGGHSNFGNNTLQSLRTAPDQNGDKIVLRDLCAGSDTKNAEAHKYPEASLNAVTSVGSSYFRTTDDPVVGKYAYESEGYDMLMSVTRGLLKKQAWPEVGADLEDRANWYGHASTNNWTHPGDKRVGAQVDSDRDGVANVFDVLPGYDTVEVAASTATEFELVAPPNKADEIDGSRAFQALQFVNTAAAYNADLEGPNKERRVHSDPTGIFFDAKDAPNEYVKLRPGPNGEHFIQYSSALADMTIESLRAVTYFELAKYLGARQPGLYANSGEANAMALVFTTAALKYDDSWRDAAIFDGLKRLYGIPASVTLWDVERLRAEADDTRHNYTGDMVAARKLVQAQPSLGDPNVGKPAVPVIV